MKKLYKLKFGEVHIHDFYVKAVIAEGAIIDKKNSDAIIELAVKHFPKDSFGYITQRIHSYSVDPTVYKDVAEIKNLVGFAVYNYSKGNSFSIIKLFKKDCVFFISRANNRSSETKGTSLR